MERAVCLDSDVLIALLSGDSSAKEILSTINARFCTSAINVFEVWHGRKNTEPVSELLGKLEVLQFTDTAARCAADMLCQLKRDGNILDLRDLFIAATCITANSSLLTFNKKHFDRLKKFNLQLV